MVQMAILLILGMIPAHAAESRTKKLFDITQAPSPADWKYFHQLPEKQKGSLWVHHYRKGIKLNDWSWGWRLGWVKSCKTSKLTYCRRVLALGLVDPALVVRAETASIVGIKYEDSGNEKILQALANSYQNKKNYRNGKPLFVVQRLLQAIHRVGGIKSKALGQRLAANHKETSVYWTKLQQ